MDLASVHFSDDGQDMPLLEEANPSTPEQHEKEHNLSFQQSANFADVVNPTFNELADSPSPTLWAMSRKDMMECSPVFPKGEAQVRSSSGGFAIGLLVLQSSFITSIHLVNSQLILHIKEKKSKEDQLSALNKTCHAEMTISVFAEANSIPTYHSCPAGAEIFMVGEFQFMEWKKDSENHRIVMHRLQDPCIRRRQYFDFPLQPDLSLCLFQGIACPLCLCALPAFDWEGWACHHCTRFFPAAPVRIQLHRYFAKANISYSGPRMDNGKAVLNQKMAVQRHLSIWSDGIKSAHYLLSPDDSELQLYHLLCSSHLEADSTRIFNLLLDRDMPYRRCTHKTTFHASFRAPDTCLHQAPPLYDCHWDGPTIPNGIKELVEVLNESISRFVLDPVESFNDVSVILSQGESLDLLTGAGYSEGIAAHRAIIHLGPSAQITIQQQSLKKKKTTLSLSHGDVVYIPSCQALGSQYEIKIMHSEVSMTCIARCLLSADSLVQTGS